MFSAIVPSNRKLSWKTAPEVRRGSRAGGGSRDRAPSTRIAAARRAVEGHHQADQRALARARGADERGRRAGRRAERDVAQHRRVRARTRTRRPRTRPRRAASRTGLRAASSSSSVVLPKISRIRSSPANASVSWVPIEAISATGATSRPVKKMYMTKSPSVIVPARIARPPTSIMITPTTPRSAVEAAGHRRRCRSSCCGCCRTACRCRRRRPPPRTSRRCTP